MVEHMKIMDPDLGLQWALHNKKKKTPEQWWREAHPQEPRMAAMMVITGVCAVEDTAQPQKISCGNERELGATLSPDFMLFFTVLLSN